MRIFGINLSWTRRKSPKQPAKKVAAGEGGAVSKPRRTRVSGGEGGTVSVTKPPKRVTTPKVSGGEGGSVSTFTPVPRVSGGESGTVSTPVVVKPRKPSVSGGEGGAVSYPRVSGGEA